MRQKLFLLGSLILMIFFRVEAQSLIIKTNDGTETKTELTKLVKFTFANDKLVFYYTDNTSESFELAALSGLYFGEISTGIETVLTDTEAESIAVYPNPAKDVIYIKNAPQGTSDVRIYRADGSLVCIKQLDSPSDAVNVSTLTFGLYVLKINNQAYKFIKL